MLISLQLLACTAVIVFAGSRISRYGDMIAEKTGMGRTWVGVILMASVTSLPELVTGISSVALYKLPNIAAGDVFGSCMFNLLILAMLDVGTKQATISSVAHQGQVLAASFGILLLGVATTAMLVPGSLPAFGWIGASSVVLLLLYAAAMRAVFKYEKRKMAEFLSELAEEPHYGRTSTGEAIRRFALYAAVLVAAAAYLPRVADEFATITGLGRTFVGTFFVALATSLPEIVVSGAAVRMGAVDLAMGNVLGSNLFNLAILALDDLMYFEGPLLSHVSANHAVTAVAAMMMTAIAIIGLTYRSKKRLLYFSWESLGIALVYLVTTLILFARR